MTLSGYGEKQSGFTGGESINQHNLSGRQSESVLKTNITHKILKFPIHSTSVKIDKYTKMYIQDAHHIFFP